jgi:small-conductance mechanosensitive channel
MDFRLCRLPIRFRVFGASSLDFELRCWVPRPELRGRIIDALNTAVYKEFTHQGIEIPYTKQDLYIKGLPESLGPLTAGKSSPASQSE